MSGKSRFNRPRHLRVHWDDEPEHELHGAEIRMKRLSVEDLQEMSTMDIPEDDEKVDGAQLKSIVDRLANGLVSWNLVDGEDDRPATRDELASDATLCMALLDRWMSVAGGVSDPLARRSTSGSPSQAVSALMDLPSESP